MSWKTTLFGLLAAIAGGIQTGTISAPNLPPWVKSVAGLLVMVFTSALGYFARDNNKSSEDVGLKPPTTQKVLVPITFLLALLGLGAVIALPACSSSPARIAYNTVAVPAVSLDHSMIAWGDYVAQYHPGAATEAKVKSAFEKAQAAEVAAIDAARIAAAWASSGNTNAPAARLYATITGNEAAQTLGDLVTLLQSLGVKL